MNDTTLMYDINEYTVIEHMNKNNDFRLHMLIAVANDLKLDPVLQTSRGLTPKQRSKLLRGLIGIISAISAGSLYDV